MKEFKTNDKLLDVLNKEGVCKTNALYKYAVENNIPVLRQYTASLLISTLRMVKPKSILEIGTAIGYSGTLMLENASVGATLDTIEKLSENVQIAKSNFDKLQLSKSVEIMQGDAIEILPKLTKTYDFIFLDGPKGQYINYLPYLIKLLNKGGILFADNVLYRGMVFSSKEVPKKKRTIVNNLQSFLQQISEHPQLKTQILNIEDGVSISIKE